MITPETRKEAIQIRHSFFHRKIKESPNLRDFLHKFMFQGIYVNTVKDILETYYEFDKIPIQNIIDIFESDMFVFHHANNNIKNTIPESFILRSLSRAKDGNYELVSAICEYLSIKKSPMSESLKVSFHRLYRSATLNHPLQPYLYDIFSIVMKDIDAETYFSRMYYLGLTSPFPTIRIVSLNGLKDALNRDNFKLNDAHASFIVQRIMTCQREDSCEPNYIDTPLAQIEYTSIAKVLNLLKAKDDTNRVDSFLKSLPWNHF